MVQYFNLEQILFSMNPNLIKIISEGDKIGKNAKIEKKSLCLKDRTTEVKTSN
jgi:hypothetical protein